ncbi:MAG: FAD binding domain-containing protein [Melioribacteraceae bacterium]|nr:FAD binding domain-containing protein [Melioribacteraceae bacterium]
MKRDIELFSTWKLDEALELLEDGNSHVIAGGTDIIPGIHINSNRFRDFNKLVDISRIKELKRISEEKDKIIIGAATTFSEIESDEILQRHLPLLVKAVSKIGSRQIRNRATIGGNFINNAPCADSVPPLLVYNAGIKINSIHHERMINLEDFLISPYRTSLTNEEIVTEIVIHKPRESLNDVFYKLGRRRGVAISRITLAILFEIKNNKFTDFKIASGAVTPIGKRFYEIENYADGKKIDRDLLIDISIRCGKAVLESTGLRWSSEYKLPVLQRLIYSLLEDNCLRR